MLDALRGLAIVLMLVDHAVAMWIRIPIELNNVRFVTRLAMPLFAVLLGYFLSGDRVFRWRRWGEIAFAGLLVNLIYWPENRELEILASLLIAAILGTVLGRFAPLMLILFLAYAVDPIAVWFDYQLSLVLPLVALGITVRRLGPAAGLLVSAVLVVMTLSGRWIGVTDTHRFAVWMTPAATLLLAAAARWPDGLSPQQSTGSAWASALTLPTRPLAWLGRRLAWLGRRPLTVYVVHFYLFAMVAEIIRTR